MSPVAKKASSPKTATSQTPVAKKTCTSQSCSDAPAAAPAPVGAKTEAASAKSVTLTIKAQPGLAVFVAGSFNNWDPTAIPMTEKKGVYRASITLDPGLYEYKFVINGVWTLDPDPERDWTQNGLGTLNSLLRVG
jgi:1,4-alpha-glucan branching enzyme